MPTLESIAVELRLQIYGYVLGFDTPLKRSVFVWLDQKVSTAKKPTAVDTAILRIFQEALLKIYNLNTIYVCHMDICVAGAYAQIALSGESKCWHTHHTSNQ
ncbi:hypothetical protein LTS10_001912 [Elasticomyces elasticus]|nr:hypothetical protein LTS10_001912 [Elasticomyces elasticus]